MRKLKHERIAELKRLTAVQEDSDESRRIDELTEEELMGELYILKRFGKPKENKVEEDDETTLYCSIM